MSNQHIIAIQGKAHMAVDTGCLIIHKDDAKHSIALLDIALILLDSPHVTITSPCLAQLAESGIVVVGCCKRHLPVYLSLPLGQNQQGAKRPHQQAKYLHSEQQGSWWQQLVQSKIYGQAHNLHHWGNNKGKNLEILARNVQLHDIHNMEAQTARIYWQEFFAILEREHGRIKQGAQDVINACLNYGYAIMRAMIARAAAGAGLCLNFGVGHVRKDNPFNLVEDFMEPFRYLVDDMVMELWAHQCQMIDETELTAPIKQQLLQKILCVELTLQQKNYRLFQAVDAVVYGYCTVLEKPKRHLLLPHMPINKGRKAKSDIREHLQL